MTVAENVYDRTNRERRERDQKAEAPNRLYAEVVERLRQRPRFEGMTDAPWTAPLVKFLCPVCSHRLFEARLDLTPINGDPFLRMTPDDTGATSDGWEGFLAAVDSPVDGDAIVKPKLRLRCQHRKPSGVQCRYKCPHTQQRLLGLYEFAVERGKGSVPVERGKGSIRSPR